MTTAVVYSSDAQVDALADNGGTLIGASGSIQVIRAMGGWGLVVARWNRRIARLR